MPERKRALGAVDVAWHVVADPIALSLAEWPRLGHAGQKLIQVAADEILAIDVRQPTINDPDAIVEPDAGWSIGWFKDISELAAHIEWDPATHVGAVNQGAVAGVPAKVWFRGPGEWYLIVRTAYAREIAERLGWDA